VVTPAGAVCGPREGPNSVREIGRLVPPGANHDCAVVPARRLRRADPVAAGFGAVLRSRAGGAPEDWLVRPAPSVAPRIRSESTVCGEGRRHGGANSSVFRAVRRAA